jgi:hypothetical protein
MKSASLIIVVLFGFSLVDSRALEPTSYGRYQPLRSYQSAPNQGSHVGYHPIKAADRVTLPGLRPNSAELLQRTLAQRYSQSLGNSPEAISQKAVPKIFSDSPSFARARGIYAEFRYVQQNPHVGLVKTRNASQNDGYSRPIGQRAPTNYQFKTLGGGPAAYARDMIKDHRAHLFVIPDDHVEGVREHWRRTGEAHLRAGRAAEAGNAFRQRNRVRPLGVTMKALEDEMREGGRFLLREQTARYVSFGAATALVLGPLVMDVAQDGELSALGARQAAHAMALMGGAAGTNHMLGKYRGGALRGTLRGNALTGAVMVLIDTSFAIHDFGGSAAFSRPAFYEQLGGGISGTALAVVVGFPVGTQVTIYAAGTGLWAPVIGGGAGFIVGGAAGLAGQFGGRSGTRMVMHLVMPDLYLQQSLQPVQEAKEAISKKIQETQSPPR